MKVLNLKILAAMAIVFLAVACSTQKKDLASPAQPLNPGGLVPPPGGGTPPAGVCPAPTPFVDGSSTTLTIDSSTALRNYTGTPINNPGTVTLMVNLHPVQIANGLGTYNSFAGEMHVRYQDAQPYGCAIDHHGTFTAGSGVKVLDYYGDYGSNSNGNTKTSYDTKWNMWNPVISNGGTVVRAPGKFRSYFIDAGTSKLGSLILIVDGAGDDGKLSGSLWFFNFSTASVGGIPVGPYPYSTMCWFVYGTPYSCKDNSIDPTGGLYQRLGRFTGLDRAAAMHE